MLREASIGQASSINSSALTPSSISKIHKYKDVHSSAREFGLYRVEIAVNELWDIANLGLRGTEAFVGRRSNSNVTVSSTIVYNAVWPQFVRVWVFGPVLTQILPTLVDEFSKKSNRNLKRALKKSRGGVKLKEKRADMKTKVPKFSSSMYSAYSCGLGISTSRRMSADSDGNKTVKQQDEDIIDLT